MLRQSPISSDRESNNDSRRQLLLYGESLKHKPLVTYFSNVIEGELEITKADIKTIAYKNIPDNSFNEEKNILALDIPGFIASASYLGWADSVPGKHPETAYFAYYSITTKYEYILCLRRMKCNGRFKPYAIISREIFNYDLTRRVVHREKPNH